MIAETDGPLTTWSASGVGVRIVAADADCVAWFFDAREDRDEWRCLGSVDQPDQIFVAAHVSVPDNILAALTIRGGALLPEGIAWQDIGRDGLALFANDSGDVVLSLR